MIRTRATSFILAIITAIAISTDEAAAKRILFLGDSQSMGAFGKTLDHDLRSAGHEVYTYVTGGATPYYWLSIYAPMKCTIGHWEKTPTGERRTSNIMVPKVEQLLDRYRPDAVVVQTGVNLYSTLRSKRRTKAENTAEVTRLIENMCKTIKNRGATSYWIAPPQSHPDRYPIALQRQFASILKSVVERYGFVYESARVTRYIDPYPQNDGIHYGATEATSWAKNVSSHLVPWAQDRRPEKKGKGFNLFSIFANNDKTEAPPKPTPPVPRAVPVAKPLASNQTAVEKRRPSNQSNTPVPDPDVFVVKKARDAGDADDEVTVEIVLREKTIIPKDVKVDYKNALAIYEWDVVRVDGGGHYPFKKIRIAHTVYFNGRPTSAINFPVGKRWSLDLVLLSKYPGVEQWQTFDTLDVDLDLSTYTAKL